ncbi:MAG TPA: hypothetical protein VE912_02595 [Bacteroidales bacterium]|nr:hypothetical protein [Bacteroidales bacterium]
MFLRGSGFLKVQSEEIDSLINIDLENGIIQCIPKFPLQDVHKLILITGNIKIHNFKAETVNGKVFSEEIDGLILGKIYDDDVENKLYGRLLREFEFSQSYEPQEIIFRLKHSRLELEFEPSRDFKNKTEIHFQNCWIESDFEIKVEDYISNIQADKSGHSICYVNKSLNKKELDFFSSIFRTTYCLGQGRFPSFKEALTSEKLTLNVSNQNLKNDTHKFISSENLSILLNKIVALQKELPNKELTKFQNALYYFENGLNSDVHLEICSISLFNVFEIIDKSSTLNKNSLKKNLNFESLYDCSFLIDLRNELIHNGLSLREAIKKIEPNNKENDKSNSELRNYFELRDYGKHVVIYQFMVDKISEHLIRQTGFDQNIQYYLK